MSIDKIIVTLAGFAISVFILWFFFGRRKEIVEAKETVSVLVDGGYKPKAIKLQKGKKTTLKILRKDPSACLEEFIVSEFKISKYLPLNREVLVEIKPQKSGKFQFHCGMNMYHGELIVE